MSDLVERAKQMPSSLNDACRTIELMSEEIKRLTERLATAESTIDTLESNARVQAKLLADTGRERDELRKQLEKAQRCVAAVNLLAHTPPKDWLSKQESHSVMRKIALTDEPEIVVWHFDDLVGDTLVPSMALSRAAVPEGARNVRELRCPRRSALSDEEGTSK
jgi:hypothetical protein